QYLLRITRAYSSTSTEALQILAGIPPIELTLEKETKTTKLLRLDKNINIQGTLYDTSRVEKVPKKWLNHPTRKNANQNIFEKVNNKAEMQIFTDGSKMDDRVGCAFVAYKNETEIYNEEHRLSDMATVYQAELYAIKKSLDWMDKNKYRSAQINSDSRAAIQTLRQTNTKTELAHNTKIQLLNTQKHINIKWVKAHVGTTGNETADELAKQALELDQNTESNIKIPKATIK
ncbi:non-ltr retrotransposon cats, partial [Lasius niger]